MPTIAVFDGIRILIHFNEHGPPHFHVRYAEYEASIDIATLRPMAGELPTPVLRRVRRWARSRQDELQEHWEEGRR